MSMWFQRPDCVVSAVASISEGSEMCLQRYVIATSTSVDISKVDVGKFSDDYFKSTEKAEKKKSEEGFFEEKKEKKELGSDYVNNQKTVRCPQQYV